MSLATKLRTEVDIEIDDARYVQIARSIHRTHKNARLTIRKGSYLYDLYEDKNPQIRVKKSTQCGISEYLIVRSINRAMKSRSILYVLPTFLLKNQFVQERINKTLLFTHLYRMFQSQYTGRFAESMSIKQFGTGTVVYSGSNTANAFISYPADDIIIDELDECSQDFLYMAEERQSASTDKTTIKVGNPSYTNYGIDYEYEKTDKKEWFIPHECGHLIKPDFFKHVLTQLSDGRWAILDKTYRKGLKRDVWPICDKCGKPYDRHANGIWAASATSDMSGYHISKMFSTVVTVKELITRFEEGTKNDAAMQRFWNGDLGLSYTVSGAKIDRAMLDQCVKNYQMPSGSKSTCVAGIDIGLMNNVIVAEVLDNRRLRILHVGLCREVPDVLEILKRYNVKCFVVDALPETRMSKKMITNHRGGFMSFDNLAKSEMTVDKQNHVINCNRTMLLDAVKEYILREQVELPMNSASIDGFYEQMTSSTRVFDEAKQRYDWLHGSAADHYLFSFAYMLLANRMFLYANR